MKRGLVLATLILVGSISAAVMGSQGPPAGQGARTTGWRTRPGAPGGTARTRPAGPLTTIKVRDNLYMIAGGGGNTAIFIQTNGVTLVDTKNPNNGQGIVDEVKADPQADHDGHQHAYP